MNNKDKKTTEIATQEIDGCRARGAGVSGFAECLCTGPNQCAYALPFGYAFLCQHPRMDEIVRNTEKEKLTRSRVD